MEKLVKANKYSTRIKELSIFSRIEIDHPILVRDTVAKRLAVAAENLPAGLTLQVDSGYRSKKTQESLWESRSKLMGKLIKNPSMGSSSHITGGAVDVSIQNYSGKEINLSEPYADYYTYPKLISSKISKRAQKYRLILNKTMLKAGFAPNLKEYWHFSYGDKNWASNFRQKQIYKNIRSVDSSYYYCKAFVILLKIYKRVRMLVRNK